MNINLSPHELAKAYLNQLQGQTASSEFNPLFFLENLILEQPENAWPVFLELLSQPLSDEELEQVSIRLELLLSYHLEIFHPRVVALVKGHAELPRFLPSAKLERARYIPLQKSDDEIVAAYLANYRTFEAIQQIEELTASSPERACPLILEIIHRGQLHNFSSFDLMTPLWELLFSQGEAVIERNEQAAASSVMLRRCLWRLKRQQKNSPPSHQIPEQIWQRAQQAARDTTDFNSALPETVAPNQLSDEDEFLLSSWYAHEKSAWGWDAIWEMTGPDPERLWKLVCKLITAATDEETLGYIGAGPLEDLLTSYGPQFIDRIEEQARIDVRFRSCLACIWQGEISEELWQRITKAVGDQS